MKKILTITAILFCLKSFAQDRNAQKRFEDSLMKATYKEMTNTKKGGAKYYKDLYDKTHKKVYLDSLQNVINIHKNRVDASVMKRKQNIVQ
jgi:hypothetical protein